MKMDKPCNLDVPTGATPMTIADAILREIDSETLDAVIYYIECFKHKECARGKEPTVRRKEEHHD